MRTDFIAVLVILGLEFVSSAATFYVSTAGDDAAVGSEAAPWRTIQRAVKYSFPAQVRSPGDTVYIRGGIYSGTSNAFYANSLSSVVPGTRNSPITFMAYPGETPIVCDQLSPDRGVVIKNLAWFVFDGITYSNTYHAVWMENCTNVLFKNCTFGWMPATNSSYANVLLWGSSQLNTISNCTFYGWGQVTTNCNDHGVSISIGDADGDTPMWYNLVVSNRFISGGHDHFQLNSAYNVIRGNTFVNAPWIPTNEFCNVLHTAVAADEPNVYGAYGNRHTKPGDSGTNQVDSRNVFEGNTFIYTGPPPDDAGAFGIELGTRQGIYRFNTISFSLAAGLYFNTSGTTSRSTSNAVYGNVLYGNGLSHRYGGEGMKDYSYGMTMSTFEGRRTNNFIVNNIIFRNLPSNVDPNILTYQQFRANFTNDASDPLFVSTNGVGYVYNSNSIPDFHIQAGSPCIDAGAFLATITSASGSGSTVVLDNSLYFSDGNQCVTGDSIQLQGATTASAVVISNDFVNNTLYLDRSITWTNGQGVSLPFNGSAPDFGAYEYSPGQTLLVFTEPVARGHLGKLIDDWTWQIKREGIWTNVQVIECPRFTGSYSSNTWSTLNYMSNAVRRFSPSAVQIVGRLPGLRIGGFSPDGHNLRCAWSFSWLGCTNLTFADSTSWGMAGTTVMESNVPGDGTPDELVGAFSIPVAVIDFSGMATNSTPGTFASGYLAGQGVCRAVDEGLALRQYFTNNLSYRRQGWTNAQTGLAYSALGVVGEIVSRNPQVTWTQVANQTNFAGQIPKMIYEQLSLPEFSPDYVDGAGNWVRGFWSVCTKSYNWEGYEGTGSESGVHYPQRRLASGFTDRPLFLVATWMKHNISPPRWFVGASDITVADAIRTSAAAQSGTIEFDISDVHGDLTLQLPKYTQIPPGQMVVTGTLSITQ